MTDYSKLISPKRRCVPTPCNIAEDGKCVFGTFDKEFENINLLEIDNPTGAPDFLKKLKLTLWEAIEIQLEDAVLVAACCDMGIFGQVLNVFYDKRKKKVYSWGSKVPAGKAVVSDNLLNGAKTHAAAKNLFFQCTNDFQDGKCHLEGWHEEKAGRIEYDFSLNRLSRPSVVSIPFDDPAVRHRPLYSQKDFFRCSGWLKINGEIYRTTDTSTAIVDDHRGYYPRRMHYDWLTAMDVNEMDGEKKWFAFNLTHNQSVGEEDYNENLIWLEGKTSLLPPVEFTRDVPTLHCEHTAEWAVQDAHDMVNIKYHVYDMFRMVVHAKPLVNIEYFIVFGELEGYVRDESGKKYILDGMVGIGEDKSLLL